MGWMLYNLSKNCPKDVKKPDCGFRGMPVQVNNDSCCPEWECPCKSPFYYYILTTQRLNMEISSDKLRD